MKPFIAFIGVMMICGSHLLVSAINGADIIDPGQQPNYCFLSGIWCRKGTDYGQLECSGAIVSPNRVVTSTQCAEKIKDCNRKWIRAGVYNMADVGVDRNISDVIKIKKTGGHETNIAVLILDEEIYVNQRTCVIPIKDIIIEDNDAVEVSGFGDLRWPIHKDITKLHLRMEIFDIVPYQECNEILFQDRINDFPVDRFCYSGRSRCVFTDDIDTGAPVVVRTDEERFLVGVASWKSLNYENIVPTVETATRVEFYREEILHFTIHDSH